MLSHDFQCHSIGSLHQHVPSVYIPMNYTVKIYPSRWILIFLHWAEMKNSGVLSYTLKWRCKWQPFSFITIPLVKLKVRGYLQLSATSWQVKYACENPQNSKGPWYTGTHRFKSIANIIWTYKKPRCQSFSETIQFQVGSFQNHSKSSLNMG